jgi:hypothetical protein
MNEQNLEKGNRRRLIYDKETFERLSRDEKFQYALEEVLE